MLPSRVKNPWILFINMQIIYTRLHLLLTPIHTHLFNDAYWLISYHTHFYSVLCMYQCLWYSNCPVRFSYIHLFSAIWSLFYAKGMYSEDSNLLVISNATFIPGLYSRFMCSVIFISISNPIFMTWCNVIYIFTGWNDTNYILPVWEERGEKSTHAGEPEKRQKMQANRDNMGKNNNNLVVNALYCHYTLDVTSGLTLFLQTYAIHSCLYIRQCSGFISFWRSWLHYYIYRWKRWAKGTWTMHQW